MLFSGISRGTEATVLQGLVPESEHQRMRCPHMGGDFPFPVKYGYCAVGVVEHGPADLVNQTVFCLHPHQDRFIVPSSDLIPLPVDLPPERAILTANMETALNIVWDAAILPGERVAIFGAGVVGTLVAYLLSRIVGVEALLVDPDLERASLASGLGITFASPTGLKGEFDCIINASGASAALSQAIDLAGFEARIVEASWYGQRQVTLSLGGAFHSRRLSLVSSQVGHVAGKQRPRWSYRRRLEKAMQLLCDPKLETLISGETLFAYLDNDYARILNTTSTLCHRVRYEKEKLDVCC
ncbi:zinc-binding alcohol dehydrogenase [Rhizobium helianthi]|uniref:Zinc-binding alcohol dehydrogenase n=1 Tax=Rhizobium helianthi TaxID=1132695 RepID=A0ABW4M372_9HYPH